MGIQKKPGQQPVSKPDLDDQVMKWFAEDEAAERRKEASEEAAGGVPKPKVVAPSPPVKPMELGESAKAPVSPHPTAPAVSVKPTASPTGQVPPSPKPHPVSVQPAESGKGRTQPAAPTIATKTSQPAAAPVAAPKQKIADPDTVRFAKAILMAMDGAVEGGVEILKATTSVPTISHFEAQDYKDAQLQYRRALEGQDPAARMSTDFYKAKHALMAAMKSDTEAYNRYFGPQKK
jgi:hypothetical protein